MIALSTKYLAGPQETVASKMPAPGGGTSRKNFSPLSTSQWLLFAERKTMMPRFHMKINEIAFFAYAVSDMKKARPFYEGVLGLKPNSEYDGSGNANWVEYDIGNATLGVGCAPGMWDPSPKGASAALEVDDFDQTLAEVKAKNIPIVMGPHDFPSCRMVVIADPDGNRIALHKRKG